MDNEKWLQQGLVLGKAGKKSQIILRNIKNKPFIHQYLKDNQCPSGVNNLRQLKKSNPKI